MRDVLKKNKIRLIVALLLSVIVLFANVAGYASDSTIEQSHGTEWREAIVFGHVSAEPATWCGATSVVVKEWDWDTETGGIVYIDVSSKKKISITRNPLAKDPFCSFDGSEVFYYKFRKDGGSDGMWEYDLKSGKTRKIGDASTDYIRNPASPTEKVYALVAGEKKYLRFLTMKLSDWKVLSFPKDHHQMVGAGSNSQWANDGSYLMLSLQDKGEVERFYDAGQKRWIESVSGGGNRTFNFYDTEGQLINTISPEKFQDLGYGPIAKGDGVYWFGKDGRLRRLNPKTGITEELPQQVTIHKKMLFTFDVSATKEVACTQYNPYDRKNESLWVASIYGDRVQRISEKGSLPVFSKTGEYIAFIRQDGKGNGILVIMQRIVKNKH